MFTNRGAHDASASEVHFHFPTRRPFLRTRKPLPAPPLSKVLGNLPSRKKEASAADRKRGVSPATPQTWDVLSSSHAASPMTIVFRREQGVRLPQRLLLPLLAEPCSEAFAGPHSHGPSPFRVSEECFDRTSNGLGIFGVGRCSACKRFLDDLPLLLEFAAQYRDPDVH